MSHVWLLRDMALVDSYDESEGRVVAAFATLAAALETRVRLEGRPHPQRNIGYRYHFEFDEIVVHKSSLSDDDILRGCAG